MGAIRFPAKGECIAWQNVLDVTENASCLSAQRCVDDKSLEVVGVPVIGPCEGDDLSRPADDDRACQARLVILRRRRPG